MQACFEKNKMKRAAYFANKGLKVGKVRDYGLFFLADKVPRSFISVLIYVKRALGKFFRFLKKCFYRTA
ncbi:hypothetical protein THIOM_004142 [Candidatus Thiomargarita nelsonii]|uniref:Uncharacterized protein n=1 Tax=Candidatus Thiomargarita nelsonii TaxID=1003181 RepID=A0A176RWP7_9GAMM|nr:hypothetical protein THIOM_004142 [Candidatus Thiomargarita nelsonii]